MGGAGYIFTGDHDADLMNNSAQISMNILRFGNTVGIKIFFSPHQHVCMPNVTN